jgi:hypothetical protein
MGQTAGVSDGAAGSGIYGAVVEGIADAYGVMRFTPNRLLVPAKSVAQRAFGWVDLLRAVDQDERPLFAAANPSNAQGLVSQGSTSGTVAGLDVVVDPNLSDNFGGFVYPSAAATFYENAGSPIQVSIDNPEKLSVEVSVFGYVALALKHPTAFRYLRTTEA